MPLYNLIPAVMLAMGLASAVAALIGRQRWAGMALVAVLALFLVGLWFPEPSSPQTARMHPFPLVLAVLLITFPLILVATGVGTLVRWAMRRIPTRDGNRS